MNNPIIDRGTNVWGFTSRRMVSGGSVYFKANYSLVSQRGSFLPFSKKIQTGFRICRSK